MFYLSDGDGDVKDSVHEDFTDDISKNPKNVPAQECPRTWIFTKVTSEVPQGTKTNSTRPNSVVLTHTVNEKFNRGTIVSLWFFYIPGTKWTGRWSYEKDQVSWYDYLKNPS